MPDRLSTLSEVAEVLGLPESRIKELLKTGQVPHYKIGGTFIRFNPSQIEELKDKLPDLISPAGAEPDRGKESGTVFPATRPGREINGGLIEKKEMSSCIDRLIDFWCFYDFYIMAGAIAAAAIFFIVKTIG